MGNKAQRLGISARAPIGSADLKRLWQIYDSKKKGRLTRDEARKFLKDLALAAEVDWDGAKADELIAMCGGENGSLDFDRFENLLFSFAEEKSVNLSHSMQSRQGIKKKQSAAGAQASEPALKPPAVRSVSVSAPASPMAHAPPASADAHAPMPPPKPKAGQPAAAPAAFEVHLPSPAQKAAAVAESAPLQESAYDRMPPLKSPASHERPPTDLTASRFEPMPLSLPDE